VPVIRKRSFSQAGSVMTIDDNDSSFHTLDYDIAPPDRAQHNQLKVRRTSPQGSVDIPNFPFFLEFIRKCTRDEFGFFLLHVQI
jgi:hypothetical protein